MTDTPRSHPLRIALLIRSLQVGGSERQFAVLAKGLAARGHTVRVFLYVPGGALESDVRDCGVALECVPRGRRWGVVGFLRRLTASLRAFAPDVLHTYGHVPGIFGSLVKPWLGRVPLVWGVGVARLDYSLYHWLVPASVWSGALFSRAADRIILNSRAGLTYHASVGYRRSRMEVIPNGIDTSRFRPDRNAGRSVRAELGIGPDETVIGYVGRLDPIKDHGTFLIAARLLVESGAPVRFLCVGGGPKAYADALRQQSLQLGLGDRVLWLGDRTDLPRLYGAMDINTSSSQSEGLSNALAEAMACGVPCVVTDVGDSALLVGETGAVVPPHDAEALSRGWAHLLAGDLVALGAQARERIVSRYDERLFFDRSEAALRAVLAQ